MKRSDVLDEIMDILELDTDPKYVDTDYYTLANSILNTLERFGMAPPKVYDSITLMDERKWEKE